MPTIPQRTRVYRCHHLDSTRWDDIVPRPDDIVITTSLKAGTTWTQRIVSLLVFQTVELPKTLHWVSPWPDSRFIIPRAEMREVVEGLRHRRFLKSHLALAGLPYWESTKYIYVGRDTRDVFMSTWNHVRAYTPFAREASVGERRIPLLVAPSPRAHLLGLPAPAEPAVRSLQRSEGGPAGRDAAHRALPRHRGPRAEVADARRGRDVHGDEARRHGARTRDGHDLRGRREPLPLQGDERSLARRPDE